MQSVISIWYPKSLRKSSGIMKKYLHNVKVFFVFPLISLMELRKTCNGLPFRHRSGKCKNICRSSHSSTALSSLWTNGRSYRRLHTPQWSSPFPILRRFLYSENFEQDAYHDAWSRCIFIILYIIISCNSNFILSVLPQTLLYTRCYIFVINRSKNVIMEWFTMRLYDWRELLVVEASSTADEIQIRGNCSTRKKFLLFSFWRNFYFLLSFSCQMQIQHHKLNNLC